MNKSRIIPALCLSVLIAWLIKDALTLLIFTGKNFDGRSLLIKLILFSIYTGFFSALWLMFFPKLMEWLLEKYHYVFSKDNSINSSGTYLSPLTVLDAAPAALIGFFSLILYIRTLAPGLQYADSGEFQTVIYSLGSTHPTGYPVYVLLGRLFTLLPIGELAYRVNLFNAFLGALTVSIIYLIIRILVGYRLAAIIAAFTITVSPLFWYFSVFAESYIPASAFMSGIFLTLLLWRLSGKWSWLAMSAFLGGLSLGVHVSVALVAPGVLVYILVSIKHLAGRERAGRNANFWIAAFSGALLGLVLVCLAFMVLDANEVKADYFHAVVRPNLSAFNLDEEDIDSPMKRIFFLFTARQFQHAMFKDPYTIMTARSEVYSNMIGMVFAPFSLVLILIGMVGLFFDKRREGLLLLISWIVTIVFMLNYNIVVSDVLVFFFPIFIYLWLGVGMATIMNGLSFVLQRFMSKQGVIFSTNFLGSVILGFTIQYYSGVITESWRDGAVTFMRGNEFAAYSYPLDNPGVVHAQAKALVDVVEDNAIVFLGWDLLFPSYFVAHIEEGRTDIDFHEAILQQKAGSLDIYESTARYIATNLSNRPVYFYRACPSGPQMDRFLVYMDNRNGIQLCKVVRQRK